MLFIDPEECIDCDACVEACQSTPASRRTSSRGEWSDYAKKNAGYFAGR